MEERVGGYAGSGPHVYSEVKKPPHTNDVVSMSMNILIPMANVYMELVLAIHYCFDYNGCGPGGVATCI